MLWISVTDRSTGCCCQIDDKRKCLLFGWGMVAFLIIITVYSNWKLNLYLCEPLKVLGVDEVKPHSLLALVLVGGDCSASHRDCCNPKKRAPGTPWIGGRVGPRTSMDILQRRKISCLAWESNPVSLVIQPAVLVTVLHRTTQLLYVVPKALTS